MISLTLVSLPNTFAIAQLPADAPIPDWATMGPFVSVTRTTDELSIVCRDEDVPRKVMVDHGWRALRVLGNLDFAMVGILASLVNPLAAAGIAVFTVSTFDTDYVLVKHCDFQRVTDALHRAGHRVLSETRDDPG
jgi:hypothetical protein